MGKKRRGRIATGSLPGEAQTPTFAGGDEPQILPGAPAVAPAPASADPTDAGPGEPVFDLGFALENDTEIGQPLMLVATAVDDFEQLIHNSLSACIARARTVDGSLRSCLAASIDQWVSMLDSQVAGLQQVIESHVAAQLGSAIEFAGQAGVESPFFSGVTPPAPAPEDEITYSSSGSAGPEGVRQYFRIPGAPPCDIRSVDPLNDLDDKGNVYSHPPLGLLSGLAVGARWTIGDITCVSDGKGSAVCWLQSTKECWPCPTWACPQPGTQIPPPPHPPVGGGTGLLGPIGTPPPPFTGVQQPGGGQQGLVGGIQPLGAGSKTTQSAKAAAPPINACVFLAWLKQGKPAEWCPISASMGPDDAGCTLYPAQHLVANTTKTGQLLAEPVSYTDQDLIDFTSAKTVCPSPGLRPPPGACPTCQQQTCCCPQPRPEPPKPPQYNVWQTGDGGVCYILTDTDPPRDSSDKLIGHATSIGAAQQTAATYCPPQKGGGPAGPPTLPPHNWPAGAWCDPDFIKSLGSPGPTIGTIAWYAISEFFRLRDSSGNPIKGSPDTNLPGWLIPVREYLLDVNRNITDGIGTLLSDAVLGANCLSGDKFSVDLIRTIFGIATKYGADIFSEFQQALEYKSHWLCPQLIPNTDQVHDAYLANSIDKNLWESWQRANNMCPEPMEAVLAARRSKPVPLQLSQMFRRGMITQQQLNDGYRQLGYLDQPTVDLLHGLTEQLANPGDIIRMMVRDADDPAIAATFHTDDGFAQKYGGQLKEWAKGQGVPDKVMQYLWRSHWSIPSPGQLFEMVHRLTRLDPADPAYVSQQDIETALVQQDILPFWIPKLLGVSYRVITRSDAQKAYQTGAVDDTQLVNIYQDLGYTLEGATALQDTEKRVRHQRWLNNRWSKLYLRGGIERSVFEFYLSELGADDETLNRLVIDLDQLRDAQTRLKCISAQRKQHLRGLTTYNEMFQSLLSLGLDVAQATTLADGISCERSAVGKHETARQLCKFLEQGLVTPQHFQTVMEQVGYEPAAAATILASCQQGITEKQLAQSQKFAKQQAAETKRLQREADRAAKEAQQQAQAALRAQQGAQRAVERREKSLAQSAERLAGKSGLSLPDAFVEVRAAYNGLRQLPDVSVTEAINAVRVGIDSLPKSGALGWQQAITDALVGAELIESDGLI